MPELPEVESIVRLLRDGTPSLVGCRVQSVTIVWPGVVSTASAPFDDNLLVGSSFVAIGRLGKYLLFQLQSPLGRLYFLIIHLRMTGRLLLVPASDSVGRHTRLALMLGNGYALRFDDPRKFGRVWLMDDAAVVTAGMGPDALNISLEQFSGRLAGHRRQLKPLLLDQSFVAGIGNIYADESLFRAGLHPCLLTSDLTPGMVLRLHAAVTTVLNEAVAAQGANIDGVFKAGQFIVNVYGRQGSPCVICGTPISKIRLGQRGTHYCTVCQPL